MKNSERVTLEAVKKPEKFQYDPAFLTDAIAFATGKVGEVMRDFVHAYPTPCSNQLLYGRQSNTDDWVQGFWTGMLWLSYEMTGNELFRAVAEAQYDDYEKRLDGYLGLNHHDIGFLYSPSMVAQYKITGSQKAKGLALRAAGLLAKRYSEGAKIIQVRDSDAQGTFIVDCSMNIPLLFWAGSVTGEREFYRKALNHIAQAANYLVRDDASTFQCFQIDELTGEPERGWQGQGHDNDSCWARGQAWVIYGLAVAYRYTKEYEYIEMAKRAANYFLNRLPSDHICSWDLIFTADGDPRDSSAAPIAACGLLETAKHLKNEDGLKAVYQQAAGSILMNLARGYTTNGTASNGLLLHGVYCKDKGRGGWGDDECCIWGDYFYMEGLMRLEKDWNLYW